MARAARRLSRATGGGRRRPRGKRALLGFVIVVVAAGLAALWTMWPLDDAPADAGIATPAITAGTDGALLAADLPARLSVAAESRTPKYQRDLFEHWTDADGNGCNARYEVLIEESTTPITLTDRCKIAGGTWVSAMDGGYATTPAEIEIDHHIPLSEAWRSGASAWSNERREAFANDLGVPYALNASSSSSNQSKGDKDPAQWMPSNEVYHCEYAITWALTKIRWSLAVDPAEHAALVSELSGDCGATAVVLPPLA